MHQGDTEDDDTGAEHAAFTTARQAIDQQDAYPDLDGYFHDVAQAYRKAIRAFYDAGCRYLQLG